MGGIIKEGIIIMGTISWDITMVIVKDINYLN